MCGAIHLPRFFGCCWGKDGIRWLAQQKCPVVVTVENDGQPFLDIKVQLHDAVPEAPSHTIRTRALTNQPIPPYTRLTGRPRWCGLVLPSSVQDAKWSKLIGARVVVDGRGEGTLSYYGRIRKTGKKMCGISLDDRVVSDRRLLLPPLPSPPSPLERDVPLPFPVCAVPCCGVGTRTLSA